MTQRPTLIQPITEGQRQNDTNWHPKEGAQTRKILEKEIADPSARPGVLESAALILGQGVSPGETEARKTGLVVGYVQSGKTLSFTTVIGLARDNKFPIVILIAGTKTPLLKQSFARLGKALDVETDDGFDEWRMLLNPRNSDQGQIDRVVGAWRNPRADPEERVTLIITVLKNHSHLGNLTGLLKRDLLHGLPVLVIDDEADQASLNTKVRIGRESTTFTKIRELRAKLPLHTYLQYTATPQATLLISIMSTLSPDFVHVLKPGAGYVGGKVFFAENSPYVEAIPQQEVVPNGEIPQYPPQSLVSAMRIFFVGLAATSERLDDNGPRQRRSMLIHPSIGTAVHRMFANWARTVIQTWRDILDSPEDSQEKCDLEADFLPSYLDLQRTQQSIPPFTEVMVGLSKALRKTEVIEFNTAGTLRTPEVQWKQAIGWILVGGFALDRGFTVNELTVTYMPRGTGVGNSDSIQQRARFFGYKQRYLGFCRIFLNSDALDAFRSYVDSEELMRDQLEKVSREGKKLKQWRRSFIMDADMALCRDSVISLGDEPIRSVGKSEWTQQRFAALPDDILDQNTQALDHFENSLKDVLLPDTSHSGISAAQEHLKADQVPLEDVLNFLLDDYRVLGVFDITYFTGLMLQIDYIRKKARDLELVPTAVVYRMRPRFVSGPGRTPDRSGEFKKGWLQGPTATGKTRYPGDRAFSADNRVTLQLHTLKLVNNDGSPLREKSPLIAIRIPKEICPDWLVQNQEIEP